MALKVAIHKEDSCNPCHIATLYCVLFQISLCKEESSTQLLNKYSFKCNCFELRQSISIERRYTLNMINTLSQSGSFTTGKLCQTSSDSLMQLVLVTDTDLIWKRPDSPKHIATFYLKHMPFLYRKLLYPFPRV